MTKRAGIFDPWRQTEAPEVDDTPARKTPTDFVVDDSLVHRQHCVQFNGIRAGIYVWVLDQDDDDSARARKSLVDVVYKIHAREEMRKMLNDWGVYLGTPKFADVVIVNDGDRKVTIMVPAKDDRLVPRAIDCLAMALREISQQFSDIRDMLAAVQIRPYVK